MGHWDSHTLTVLPAPFPEVLGSDGVFDNLYLEEAWMEGWMGI